MVSFTPWPLYPQGKSLLYLLDMRLGGPQSRYGRGGEEKSTQPLPGLEPRLVGIPKLLGKLRLIGKYRLGRPLSDPDSFGDLHFFEDLDLF
jgi:hypothetical protein